MDKIRKSTGLKYTNVDFGKGLLYINGQIGRDTSDTGLDTDELYCQVIPTKTKNGVRTVPIAEFVIDEIVMAKQKYDVNMATVSDFHDYGFICCQSNGRPYNKSGMYKAYHRLFKQCGMDEIKWHGLRHTYSSLLAEEGVSMKAVSECMGHYSEEFTKKAYVTVHKKLVFDAVNEIEEFWEQVKSKEKEICETCLENYNLALLQDTYTEEQENSHPKKVVADGQDCTL